MTLMAAKNEYDTAILVSNDGDYLSGVKSVKELGKKIEILFFKNSLSSSLKFECDLLRRARPSFFKNIVGL